MKIIIAAIGKIGNNSYENKLIENYLQRLPLEITIKELEVKKNYEPEKLKEEEGKLLLAAVPADYSKIVLDERGRLFNSKLFTENIQKFRERGNIAFLIGGAFGHAEEVRKKADLLLSLSPMTFPHLLCRLLLVEQLYRAYTISRNHPYHK